MAGREELDRLCVVLVRARDPNNIGAVARAMYDFGFHDLRLVNEYPVPLERARSAIDASSVLTSAREYSDVAHAIADCTLVVGTTAVGLRRREHPVHTVAEAADKLRAHVAASSGEHRAALLFGSEKTGLSNEELSYCHWLLTIPMHQTPGMRHPSLNLGQAAAICLYEVVRSETEFAGPGQLAPTGSDLDRLTALLLEVLVASDYNRRHPAHFDEIAVRRMVLHMELDRSHTLAWMGILRQVLWKLRQRTTP